MPVPLIPMEEHPVEEQKEIDTSFMVQVSMETSEFCLFMSVSDVSVQSPSGSPGL